MFVIAQVPLENLLEPQCFPGLNCVRQGLRLSVEELQKYNRATSKDEYKMFGMHATGELEVAGILTKGFIPRSVENNGAGDHGVFNKACYAQGALGELNAEMSQVVQKTLESSKNCCNILIELAYCGTSVRLSNGGTEGQVPHVRPGQFVHYKTTAENYYVTAKDDIVITALWYVNSAIPGRSSDVWLG